MKYTKKKLNIKDVKDRYIFYKIPILNSVKCYQYTRYLVSEK